MTDISATIDGPAQSGAAMPEHRGLQRIATIASAVSCLRDRRTTLIPPRAATSATPEPMIPDPTMPSFSTAIAGGYRTVTSGAKR